MKNIKLLSGHRIGRSGARGVTWYEKTKKWKARAVSGGRRIDLGYHKTVEEAVMAVEDSGLCDKENGRQVEAIVSDEDYEYLSGFVWHLDGGREGSEYAYRNLKPRGMGKISMHMEVMIRAGTLVENMKIDHINTNPLDNRRSNLRPATDSNNAMNTKRRKDNTSGVKGVCWDRNRNKWIARINANCMCVWSKRFDDFDEAVRERKSLLVKFHGEYARSE